VFVCFYIGYSIVLIVINGCFYFLLYGYCGFVFTAVLCTVFVLPYIGEIKILIGRSRHFEDGWTICQPHRHLSQMHAISHTSFYTGKGDLL